VRTLAAVLAAVSMQCAAAPFAVQVGETRIGLDAPPVEMWNAPHWIAAMPSAASCGRQSTRRAFCAP